MIEKADFAPYLTNAPGVDCAHPRIRSLARDLTRGLRSHRKRAAALFAFVRDGVRYVPYAPFESLADYEGPVVLERGFGFCTQKSALLVALARAAGIPARFHYADLLNRNMPGRLEEVLRSDRMIFHTYVDLHLGDRWLKVTPSFEAPLCAKMGWHLAEFDGTGDALLQKLDLRGKPHVDYVLDRGHRPGIPLGAMLKAWREGYGVEALERWRAACTSRGGEASVAAPETGRSGPASR